MYILKWKQLAGRVVVRGKIFAVALTGVALMGHLSYKWLSAVIPLLFLDR